MAQLRDRFARRGDPIVSVDTKKLELVGRFKNPGRAWSREALRVYDHDFRSQAEGIAIPYGIYDLQAHRATIFVGVSSDTPQFASDCLAQWWRLEGRLRREGGRRSSPAFRSLQDTAVVNLGKGFLVKGSVWKIYLVEISLMFFARMPKPL